MRIQGRLGRVRVTFTVVGMQYVLRIPRMCVRILMETSLQSACAVLYCHLWPVPLYHIFPHYLINGKIFGFWGRGKLLNIKFEFVFSQFVYETFFIPEIIQQDTRIITRWFKYDRD